MNPALAAALASIDHLASRLHCIAELDPAARVSGSREGALAGVPVLVKENIAQRGLHRSAGMPWLRVAPSAEDARVTSLLREAGAALLGTTRMAEGGWAAHDPAAPRPVNPRNAAVSTSGSSSGSAVAVAAGLCTIALGTDTGGSVRQPAAACGVYGYKPAWGAVPMAGVVPMAPEMDHVGLLTRRVDDLRQAMGVLSGRRGAGAPRGLATGAGTIRVAVPIAVENGEGLAPSVRIALRKARESLQDLGLAVRTVAGPTTTDLWTATQAWLSLCAPEAWRSHLDLWGDRRAEAGPALRALLDHGRLVSPAQVAQALRERAAWRQLMARVLQDYDLLLLPVTASGPSSALAVGVRPADPQAILPAMLFTAPLNLSGEPALALPCGPDAAGIPQSVQLVARSEETLLCVAAALEEAWGAIKAESGTDGDSAELTPPTA